MPAPQTKGYDSMCEMLAEYFLGQPRSPEDVKDLAQCVQDAVEDWFVQKAPLTEFSNANLKRMAGGE
jgi:hypothetical protein